ncbi:hypothetical protein AB6846_24560 [Serratia proteamaculans]
MIGQPASTRALSSNRSVVSLAIQVEPGCKRFESRASIEALAARWIMADLLTREFAGDSFGGFAVTQIERVSRSGLNR